ncbi:hypothetical protein HHK36_024302 [Tetracentron sinense]|uniref:Regulator of Vps4 activity in the MVB pathway protein n=1 Tax=Tetracentron sinense TaxID=13715 RepID=A0A834YNM1_TETSI|nr:hypothetical protein HHK36_024302 [Tetracentron sinense]
MGRKLDALLGRTTFKISKLKPLVSLAISRLAILKNQRQVRCSQSRSDVLHLLNAGHHDRALLRVEHVIKDKNFLDVFVMLEGYCHLLIERVSLMENSKECPEELKEAISSLLFAASRCGEFPELIEIRAVFASLFGKEFVARAVELRNNCGVNHKMIQKLSTRQPSLESRLMVLKEIASENEITLHLEEAYSVINEEKLDLNQKQNQPENDPSLPKEIEQDKQFSGSMKSRKYKDVAAAAQAAFESAAYAADAARAAVELSRSESQDKDPDDQSSRTPRQRYMSDDDGSSKSRFRTARDSASGKIENSNGGLENIHPVNKFSSESEDEEIVKKHKESRSELKRGKNKAKFERSPSSSSSDSAGDETNMSPNVLGQIERLRKEIVYDETGNEQNRIPWSKHRDLDLDRKSSYLTNEFPKTRQFNAVKDDRTDENGINLHNPSQMPIRLRSGADPHNLLHVPIDKLASGSGNPMAYATEGRSGFESAHYLDGAEEERAQLSNIERRPISLRSRRV